MLPPRTLKPALTGEPEADWLVIRAGYPGLGAARRFAENRPNERVILLEAHEAGENASGRKSGFAIDLPHVIGGGKDELEGSHPYMAMARAAIGRTHSRPLSDLFKINHSFYLLMFAEREYRLACRFEEISAWPSADSS